MTATSVIRSDLSASAVVTVTSAPAVTSVAINEGPQELVVGGSVPLSVTVAAVGGASEAVVWSSEPEGVVTVDGDGVLVAVAPGEATVTATSVFAPGVRGSVTVTVRSTATPAVGVSVAPSIAELAVSGTQSFTASVTGASDTRVSWSATCGSLAGTGNTVTYTAPAAVPAGGTCRVRATSLANETAWAEATVTVVEAGVAPAVTSVVINEGPQEVVVRGSVPLSVTVAAVGGASEAVVWSSDRERVVTVDRGVLVGVAQGRATVTATSVFAPEVRDSVTVDVVADFERSPSYITIENVSVGAANAATLIPASTDSRRVSFDIRWPDSWRGPSRPTWVASTDNWDAAWVFLKYRVDGGTWHHATLAASGHVAPSGAVVDVPGDRVGAFVYRSGSGYGTFAANGVGLQWDYLADGVSADASVEVMPFAIEMVYVPQGSFAAGSGGSGTGEFRAGGTENTPFWVAFQSSVGLWDGAHGLTWTGSANPGTPSGSTNASFPTGFAAFYVMKYQVTQGQYVDFLNTLTQPQATARKFTGSGNRYEVTGDSVGSYATSLPYVAMNYMNWADGAAFADWAGLRPMTELEFEKVARGPRVQQVADEYAWGSTIIIQPTELVDAGTSTEAPRPRSYPIVVANANFASAIDGPVRVGAFIGWGDFLSDHLRVHAGAGYYGAMELSGNLWERTVTLGNAEGRAFAGTHGDGSLDAGGDATNTDWPGPDAAGAGLRGGSWASSGDSLRVSDRSLAAFTFSYRMNAYGWRGVRSRW